MVKVPISLNILLFSHFNRQEFFQTGVCKNLQISYILQRDIRIIERRKDSISTTFINSQQFLIKFIMTKNNMRELKIVSLHFS